MMKISKPVLMNDFMFSHVQFTSLNLVNFKNIKAVYGGNEKILLEYEHPSKVEVSSRDWIGIFPRGWSNLQQYVTFEWMSQATPSTTSIDQVKDGEMVRRTVAFCPKYHMNCVNQSAFYQFVYVGKQIEVLGVSSYFRFDLSCLNDTSLELECLVPVSAKVRSTSVSDFGTISMKNEQSSTSVDSRKLIHASSIHSLQNLDTDGKLSWGRMNFGEEKKNACMMKRTTTSPTGTGDNIDPYSSHSEPVFPMSLPLSQCKKCYHFKRGDFLRSQQALQSKLKIVMERNKILEERALEMKKELERLQNESKRMKMSYFNVNKEKVAYENFVKDFIKSLEKDSIVRVMYGNTEILVKKVNYVGMEEHPRDKKTSKRERELKAVIGLQEITIRNLINSLQEKAKSVEELNETVKLARVFSAARADNRELGIEAEESGDEISNSSAPSEYEFSLAKPSPPEEVSADTDDVLDNIRRTSEMELKNIGITRSLGTGSDTDLDVSNLSILTYDSEDAVAKKPRLVDNLEDCWPFPRNPTKTFRQKLSEENITLHEKNNLNDNTEAENNELLEESMSERADGEKEGDMDAELTAEDYYDAYDGFSVKSYSPESPEVTEDTPEENETTEVEEEKKDELTVAEVEPEEKNASDEKLVKFNPPEKFNKFTCELSIDFVQKRSQSNPAPERTICKPEEVKPEQNALAIRESEVAVAEEEKSLITFKKSNRCLEIKITKLEQTGNTGRGFQQKMVVEFVGSKATEEASVTNLEAVEAPPPPPRSDEEIAPDGCKSEISEGEAPPETQDVQETKFPDLDVFSPRTQWDDANDYIESYECAAADDNPKTADEEFEKVEKENEPEEEAVEKEEEEKESESPVEEPSVEEKMIMQLEEKKSEITQEFLKSKCNIQMLTEDSIKNLKIYQDSLRYEKNLQFLNNKLEGKCEESEDETLKDKPSAILIQTGQSKVAVIRYQ